MQRPMRFGSSSSSSSRRTSEQGRAGQEEETGGRNRALHSETSATQHPSPPSRRLTPGQDRSRTTSQPSGSAANPSRPAEGGNSGGWVWPCARAKRPASPLTRPAPPPAVAQPLQAPRGIPTAPPSPALVTSVTSHSDNTNTNTSEANGAMLPSRHPSSSVSPLSPPAGPTDSPPRRASAARLEPTGQSPPNRSPLRSRRSLLRPWFPSSSRRSAAQQRPAAASAELPPPPPPAARSSSPVSRAPPPAPPTATNPPALLRSLSFNSNVRTLIARVSNCFLRALCNYVILVGRTSARTLIFSLVLFLLLLMAQSSALVLLLLPLLIPVIYHIFAWGHPLDSVRNSSTSTPPSDAQRSVWQELLDGIQEFIVRAVVALLFFIRLLLTLLQTAAVSVSSRAPASAASAAAPPVVSSHTGSLPLPAPTTESPSVCAICLDAPATHLCYPCGQKEGCLRCLTIQRATFKKCPICRAAIQDIIRVIDVS